MNSAKPVWVSHFPSRSIQRYFVEAQGLERDDEVTRIEWRYLDGGAS